MPYHLDVPKQSICRDSCGLTPHLQKTTLGLYLISPPPQAILAAFYICIGVECA